ncbi:MAG TPA: hypothetical protein VFU36_10095 [Jatrophihabitans sp.]|nr:hypothetical protein [Jatrophihabitans sp.]
MTRRIALLAALAAGGCSLAPDVGPRLAGTCDDSDGHAGKPLSFSTDIHPLIIRPMGGCGCHLPTPTGDGTGTQISGLNLSSLSTLRMGGLNSGARVVIAGDPCASIMYQKLSDAPPFGSRMPLNGPPYWTPEELQLLHDWIAEGAKDN